MKIFKFFILSLFSFTIVSSFSQDIRFGIKGSGNLCGLYGPDEPSSYKMQTGFSGGLFLDSRFAEHMSSQVELNFTRYNFQFSEHIDYIEDAYFNVVERNDYISLPVVLKYKRGYEILFWYFSFGGQVSVLTKHKRDVSAYSKKQIIDSKTYYNFKTNWYDYGLNISAGFQFKPITIGLSYYISMRSLYKEMNSREMRYKVLNLNISYQFNYRNPHPYDRKKGMKGLKYKLKNLF